MINLIELCATFRLKTFHWLTTSRLCDRPPLSSTDASVDGWTSEETMLTSRASAFVRSQWLMEVRTSAC